MFITSELEANEQFLAQVVILDSSLHYFENMMKQLTSTTYEKTFFSILNFTRGELKHIYKLSQTNIEWHALTKK